MKATFRTGLLTATFALVALTQPSPSEPPQQANPNTVGGSYSQKLPQPDTPKWNPGFGEQVPNKELSGSTPQTNSTLQKDQGGDMGNEYFGWLGLLGLAGLFGLSRGTNPAPRPDNRG
jgi:MYXO-CTERM domain-containing protein